MSIRKNLIQFYKYYVFIYNIKSFFYSDIKYYIIKVKQIYFFILNYFIKKERKYYNLKNNGIY